MDTLLLLLPAGKVVLASVALWFCYVLLFRDRASFKSSRIFLLSLPLASLAIGLPSITIYTPDAQVVEVKQADVLPQQDVYELSSMPESSLPETQEAASVVRSVWYESITWTQIAGGVYALIAAVLLLFLLVQYIVLLHIKRKGVQTTVNGIRVVASREVKTPFSFGKTIFVNTAFNSQKMKMVLEHESWHIKHGHYVDVMIMELTVRLLWINPLFWIIRNELRNIHEYQADQSVIEEGEDLYTYQTTILEEVMANSPLLANGFNSSFIKKRFLMMKQGCRIERGALRKVLVVPYLLLLFCLFSFSIGSPSVVYKYMPIVQDTVAGSVEQTPIQQTTIEQKQDTSVVVIVSKTRIVGADTTETVKKVPAVNSAGEKVYHFEISSEKSSKQPSKKQESEEPLNVRTKKVELPISDPHYYKIPISTDPNIDRDLLIPQLMSIEKKNNLTVVTFAVPVTERDCELFITSDLNLVNSKSRSKSVSIKAVSSDIPLDVRVSLKQYVGSFLEVKLYFQPIPDSWKEIDIVAFGIKNKDDFKFETRNINLVQFQKNRIKTIR